MAETIKIKGLPRLISTLNTFERDIADAPKKINKEAAAKIATTARGNAPHRTGRLAASIHATGGNPATIGTSLSYARFVHFGSIHNPRPVPFLYDALDAETNDIVDLYAKRVQEMANKVRGV